jgi:hypothetical protein
MKGRRTPPPPPPSPEQKRVQALLDQLVGKDGFFVLEVIHQDGCRTISTQNERDCTCSTVEQQIIDLGKASR